MDIGREGKGREESISKPVQMSKEEKSSLEWGTGGRWCQHGAMDTMGTANSLFPDPGNRQKQLGNKMVW